MITGNHLLKHVQANKAGLDTGTKRSTNPKQAEKQEKIRQSAQARTAPTVTASSRSLWVGNGQSPSLLVDGKKQSTAEPNSFKDTCFHTNSEIKVNFHR